MTTSRVAARTLVGRKWVIVTAAVVTTLVAVIVSATQPKVYVASADVVVQASDDVGTDGDRPAALANGRAIQTEIRAIEGQTVRTRVQEDLGLTEPPPAVNATPVAGTDIVSVSIRSTTAANTAVLANAYAEAYLSTRREQAIGELLAAGTATQDEIDARQLRLDAMDSSDPRREPLIDEITVLTEARDEMFDTASARTAEATIIETATVPTVAIEPTPLRTAMLALGVGVLLGVAAALLLGQLDVKVRSSDELQALTAMAVLAEVGSGPVTATGRPVVMIDPTRPVEDADLALASNVRRVTGRDGRRVVQFTSVGVGNGTTAVASRTAVALARSGLRVALLDGDLRTPRTHDVWGLPASPGIADVILGASRQEVVRRVDLGGDHELWVYPGGTIPEHPGELLSGRRLRRLVEKMGEHYDVVVVDSAPVLGASDALALATIVDGVIVVVRAGRPTRDAVAQAVEQLDHVDAPFIGSVLVRTGPETTSSQVPTSLVDRKESAEPDDVSDEDAVLDETGEVILSDA